MGYVTARGTSYAEPAASDVFVKAVRAYLAAKLPSYMVPAHIVVLDELPLTRNGKVDRKALPVPLAEPDGAGGNQPPAGELEARLTAIWQGLLGDRRVSVTDDWFAMGATSLLVAQAHRRVVAELAPGLALGAMFLYPSIRALASHLDTAPAAP